MKNITLLSLILFSLPGLLSADLITNGDFEDDLGVTVGSGVANFFPDAGGWFDENDTVAGDGDFIQWEDANVNVPDDANGEVWGGLGISNAGGQAPSADTGAFYQSIGTYEDNLSITVSFNVGDRSNKLFPDLQVSLYFGNVTGADGSSLSGLGAILLDSSALITAAGLGFDDSDSNTHTASVTPFVLDTGTSGTTGETLWLEIRATTTGIPNDYQALIDDITAEVVVPEPSSLLLLGVGLTLALVRRSRSKEAL